MKAVKAMKAAKRIMTAIMCCVLIFSAYGCATHSNTETAGTGNGENTKDVEYVALETGFCDCVDFGKHNVDFTLWRDNMSYRAASAPAEYTVTFDGVSYVGDYEDSSIDEPNTYIQHCYMSRDDKNVLFYVNADTAELSGIRFIADGPARATISEAECRSIADRYAAEYIKLDEYVCEVSVSEDGENYHCYFKYYREVDGYKTCDGLRISVDGNGNLGNIKLDTLNSFKNAEHTSFDEAKATEAIETKLDAIFAEVDIVERSYKIKDKTLLKLQDGAEAVLYDIEVEQTLESSSEKYGDMDRTCSEISLLVTPQK